jgi:hypothetical protein
MPRGENKIYMANEIVRMGASNCFEELTSLNMHLMV